MVSDDLAVSTVTRVLTRALDRVPAAIDLIRGYPSPDTARALAAYPTVTIVESPDAGGNANYEDRTSTIELNARLDNEPTPVLAAVLFHELLHAANHAQSFATYSEHLTEEAEQTVAESKLYRWLYRNTPFPSGTQVADEELDKQEYLRDGDDVLFNQAVQVYAHNYGLI